MTQQLLVPIDMPGGLGDLAVAFYWLRKLRAFLGPQHIMRLYSNHLLSIGEDFASDLKPVEVATRESLYSSPLPYWIELTDLVNFRLREGTTNLPEPVNRLYRNWLHKLDDWGPLISAHPRSATLVAKQAKNLNLDRATLASWLVGFSPTNPISEASTKITRNGAPLVTVHHGFDVNWGVDSHRSMKNLSFAQWKRIFQVIRWINPDVEIIQLGDARSPKLEGINHEYLGCTSFRQSVGLAAGSALHIDGDSGLVHWRRLAGGGPSVVFFGPTAAAYYGYPENLNIQSPFCSPCWWTKDSWMFKCMLGFNEPECMNQHDLSEVFEDKIRGLNVI
jgi:hypothetical protein